MPLSYDAPSDATSPATSEPTAPAADPEPAKAKPRGRAALLTAALVAALVVLALVSAGTGAYRIPVGEVLGSVRHHLGLGGTPWTGSARACCGTYASPASCSPCSSGPAWAARAP